jgi:hypothetical protein
VDIGKPRRVHRVEPIKDPVPRQPAQPERPAEPKQVPAK